MTVVELNCDGLVGSTHHYTGLSWGNIASTINAFTPSNPQAAARQGLQKMRLLHNLGLQQAIIPPQQRPNLQLLHQMGFRGSPTQQINKVAQSDPQLLSACYSASSMWTANAATVSPSTDTQDAKVHFTTANLESHIHRSQEAEFTKKILERLFENPQYFHHHNPLPSSNSTGDEGAANHIRLCLEQGDPGVHLFVYGREGLWRGAAVQTPHTYPARQTKEASEAIARNHLLNPEHTVFACQNPDVIDQGVFHNDVICLSNESVFIVHEKAFCDQKKVLDALRRKSSHPITLLELSEEVISIHDAVNTYLFNSQLITLPNTNQMLLLAPIECQEHQAVKAYIDTLIQDSGNPIQSVHYMDLKQSMRNGGGPACLRLRIPLKEMELQAMHQGVIMDNPLLDSLDDWLVRHYRTELRPQDLADPQLINESLEALDELTQILKLGSFYPFQLEKSV
ncbi:MAG: N-succinylarginine dihydrolase [Legionellales bacterium]